MEERLTRMEECMVHIEARVGDLVQQLAYRGCVGEDCGVVFPQGINEAINSAQGTRKS